MKERAIAWCATLTTSSFCAAVGKVQGGAYGKSPVGWGKRSYAAIPRRRMLATVCKRERVSAFLATDSKQDDVVYADKSLNDSRNGSGTRHGVREAKAWLACGGPEPHAKGWFAYFKHAHERTYVHDLDGQIRRRLRALLRKQEKRPGFGRFLDDHQRWPKAFFAKAGLFAMHTAWLLARQSR